MKFVKIRNLRCVLVILMLVVLLVALLIPIAPLVGESMFGKYLQDTMHVPLFFVVTLLCRFLQQRLQVRWDSLMACALFAGLVGGLVECAQSFTGRSPGIQDLVANFAGILLACAVLMRGQGWSLVVSRCLSLLLGGGLTMMVFSPVMRELAIIRAKHLNFPALLDFRYETGMWQAQGATELEVVELPARAGGVGLDIQMAAGSYGGLRYVFPEDLYPGGFSGLLIETDNPGDSFELGIRIDGDKRQYRGVRIPHGRSEGRIEWKLSSEHQQLARLVLFTGENQPARRFTLLNVRLIKEK